MVSYSTDVSFDGLWWVVLCCDVVEAGLCLGLLRNR